VGEINGQESGTPWNGSSSFSVGTNRRAIGISGYIINSALLNDHIDDLRITNG